MGISGLNRLPGGWKNKVEIKGEIGSRNIEIIGHLSQCSVAVIKKTKQPGDGSAHL